MNAKGKRAATKTVLIGTSLRDFPVQRHFAALGRELIECGYQVYLLAHGSIGDASFVDSRISVLRWPSPRPICLADMLFFDRLVRRLKPCCVISNFGAMSIMMTIGGLRHVPVRIHWHHTLSSQIEADSQGSRLMLRLRRWRARIPMHFATHAVANSNAARQDIIDTFGVAAGKCQVFWNSLDDPMAISGAASAAGATGARSRHFICVGRFDASKGQDILIRAVGEVARKHPEVAVEFIGDGPEWEACEELAARLRVFKKCVFAGRLPHPRVLTRMAEAWAAVVPSRNEAFGLVNIESLAVGVPVIGSNTGGIAEVIRDGVDGFLFPPGNDKELARHMIELMENENLRATMAKNARLRYLEHFGSSRAVPTQAEWIIEQIQSAMKGALCEKVAVSFFNSTQN